MATLVSPMAIKTTSAQPLTALSSTVQNRVPHDDSNEEDFHQRAAEHASRNAGGSGGADFFQGILGNFMGNKSQLASQEVDEQGTLFPSPFFFGHTSIQQAVGNAKEPTPTTLFGG